MTDSRAEVEQMNSFRLLRINITANLSWTVLDITSSCYYFKEEQYKAP